MVEIPTIFASVGIIILLGFLSDLIFSKTQIPDVIWLIILGILIGPAAFSIIDDPTSLEGLAKVFTSFALLFILFEGGLHIRIKDLMRSMYGASTITVVNFFLTVIVITAIAKLAGWNLTNSLLLGTILGGTSSAVVVPIVRKLSMGPDNSLVLILESAFSDVLCIVASLSIIRIVTVDNPNFGGVLNSLFGSFAIAIFVGGIAGFIWILLMEKFPSLSRSYISTIGVLMLVFSLTELAVSGGQDSGSGGVIVSSGGAIAGLTFGIVVGNSRKILSLAESEATDTLSVSARAFFSQISFFVKTFFFVYIGLLLNLNGGLFPIFLGFLISVAIFFTRPFSVKLGFRPGEKSRDRAVMESMIPKGLAAAVLAQIPSQYGIPGADQIITPVISTIFFTIVITTIMIFISEKTRYPGTSALFFRIIGKNPRKKKTPVKPGVEVIQNSGQDQANTQEESVRNKPDTAEKQGQKGEDLTVKPDAKQPKVPKKPVSRRSRNPHSSKKT